MNKLNIDKSLAMQDRAIKRIPGMTQLLSKRPDLFSKGVWPTYFSKANGCSIWDLDGNHYVDMSIGGIGANVLGYCDPDVDSAVIAAIRQGSSSSLNCSEEVELAEVLCDIHPWADMVRYTRSGGESMAVAVRIARASTGKDKVVFCGYHGWHDWYLAANIGTKNALGEHLIAGLNPNGVPKGLEGTAIPFSYNNLNSLASAIAEAGDDLAAIVIEPIRNVYPTAEFIFSIHAAVEKTGAVLVVDEISSGFRMNSAGAHIKLGWNPDIAVFSKALGNGYPIGAVIGKASVMESAQRTFISSTYWTERIGPVAALAMINKHQTQDVGRHLVKIGKMVQEGWSSLAKSHDFSIQIGGIPPLGHFAFNHPEAPTMKAFFIQEMLLSGYLASTSFYSMLTHTDKIVESYLDASDKVFKRMRQHLDGGTLDKVLLGSPSVSGFQRLN